MISLPRNTRERAPLLAAVAVLIASQFVPLTNRLGYESAILLNAVILWLGVPYTCLRLISDGEGGRDDSQLRIKGAWTQWVKCLVPLSILAMLGLGISLANSVFVQLCDVRAGIEYWALFGLGGVPLHAALAVMVLSVRGRSARIAVFLGIVLTSIGSSLWYLYWQPPIVVYDLFHGYFAGSIYDESLIGSGLHWLYRSYTALFAIGVVGLCDLSRAIGHSRVRSATSASISVISLTLCVGLFTANASQGLRIDRAEIESQLGARIETEHFVIHVSAGSFSARERALLAADHEARFEELADFWGVRPTRMLNSYVYGSKTEKGRLMGGRNTLVAKVWLDEMHIVWSGPGDDLLAHEMSHLFLRPYGSGPLKLPNRFGVIPVMGLVEGSATAAAWGTNTLTPHGWSAAMLHIGSLPDVGNSLDASRFWSQPSGVVYTALGSFSRWIVETYGPAAYLELYASSDFEKATGSTLAELIAEWKSMLEALPLEEADVEEARYAFDRSSIFQARCPRAGAGWIERAEEAAEAGNTHIVLVSSDALQENDLLTGSRFLRLIDVLIQVGEVTKAESMLREFAGDDSPSIAEHQRAFLKLADLAWTTDDLPSARSWLAEMRSSPMSADLERAVYVRERALQSDDESTDVIYGYLADDAVERWLKLVELVSIAETDASGLAAYLSGLLLAGRALVEPGERLLTQAVDELRGTPLFRRALRERALHRVAHGDERGCDDWRELAVMCAAQTICASEATMWAARCEAGWWPFEQLTGSPSR